MFVPKWIRCTSGDQYLQVQRMLRLMESWLQGLQIVQNVSAQLAATTSFKMVPLRLRSTVYLRPAVETLRCTAGAS